MGLRQWDQVVEFTEFDPGRALTTHIVEGAMPVDGRWTFEDDGAGGTRVRFVAEGELSGPGALLAPLLRRGIDRSFRRYHALLARNLEAAGGT
jgi:Polyketide cyclase / dehydrase and lipid transport